MFLIHSIIKDKNPIHVWDVLSEDEIWDYRLSEDETSTVISGKLDASKFNFMLESDRLKCKKLLIGD